MVLTDLKGKTFFLCSDIHSFYVPFRKALKEAGFDAKNKNHILIIIGDLFDRGPDSVKMLRFVRRMPKSRLILIRGNHEDLYEKMLDRGDYDYIDYCNGTVRTVCDITLGGMEEEMEQLIRGHSRWHDYVILDKYIITHGYVPTPTNYESVAPIYWASARWGLNYHLHNSGGNRRIRDGRTIICGHCNCAEWRGNGSEDYTTYYAPDGSAINLDACTVLSGFVNVLKLSY